MGSYLLPGLVALGHRVRALAPITQDALRLGDTFALRHPEIAVARYLVPFFSNASEAGSADRDYRLAEDGAIREALPQLVSCERPDVLIHGREAIALQIAGSDNDSLIPSVLIVHGGATFERLATDSSQARDLLEQFRKMNLIVAVARHLSQTLSRVGLRNVKFIPNMVDLDQFSPAPKDPVLLRELNIASDRIVVLHVSKLARIKRPLDLVASAEIAVRKESRLIYLVVGDGPYRATMVETCKRKGLSENFRFINWMDHDRLARYMNLAEIVAMPSESEGQSLVCLEAQACGRFLLASDIPGAREIIADGETGLLFKKGDVNDLATKVLWAAANPEARAAIGRKAREAVRAHAHTSSVREYSSAFTVVAGDGAQAT